MYKRILLNSTLPLKKRLKNALIYTYLRRNASASWRIRFRKTKELNPALFGSLDKSIEQQHRIYWRPFRRRLNIKTLRVSANLSQTPDYRYFPEEIFVSDIEPTLNNESVAKIFAVKNFYSHWYGQVPRFPNIIVNKISNEYFDVSFNRLSREQLDMLLETIDTQNVVV